MNPYALLGSAIVAELFGTAMLELSDGFSRPLPTAGVLVGYLGAFSLVSLVLEDLPLGVVYATWAALGSSAWPRSGSCSSGSCRASAASEAGLVGRAQRVQR